MTRYRVRPYLSHGSILWGIQKWRWWFPVWTWANFLSESQERAMYALEAVKKWG